MFKIIYTILGGYLFNVGGSSRQNSTLYRDIGLSVLVLLFMWPISLASILASGATYGAATLGCGESSWLMKHLKNKNLAYIASGLAYGVALVFFGLSLGFLLRVILLSSLFPTINSKEGNIRNFINNRIITPVNNLLHTRLKYIGSEDVSQFGRGALVIGTLGLL